MDKLEMTPEQQLAFDGYIDIMVQIYKMTSDKFPKQEVIVKNVIRLPLDFFGYWSIMWLVLANLFVWLIFKENIFLIKILFLFF